MRLLLMALMAVASFSRVDAETVVIRGCDTLGNRLVPALAEAYRQAGNDVPFDIVGQTSSSAFKALEVGASIGMSSRPVTDEERELLASAGITLQEHVAAKELIAVIVNQRSPVVDLPLAGVEKIFTGEAGAWKMLPGFPEVVSFVDEESSRTDAAFRQVAMHGKNYGKTTFKCDGNGEIVRKVAETFGGVGYVKLSSANGKGVKAVKVNGVAPKPGNAAKYPLARKLYYYTVQGQASDEALAFIRWATTDPGAATIITELGFGTP